MYNKFQEDKNLQLELLDTVLSEAGAFLSRREEDTVYPIFPQKEAMRVSDEGLGARGALDYFLKNYAPYVSLNTGPRFYGFVVGGVTPAALA
ncbi:MAG: aspartate aminotransferase family protein, partial [Clostridiales bacterium]|nr:aspartate aminotransferase family protein [Clostridiales bacterium]